MDTSPVGCEARTTVKVAVPPASEVISPRVGLTMMPAVSRSRLIAEIAARLPL
ncbi:MAG: hypothetical protein ACUVUC_15850 [Thermoguttaceae bacterium]